MIKNQNFKRNSHVDDLINGMILLMDSNYQNPINIGNPNEFSIKELAELVRKLINPNKAFCSNW